MRGLVMLAVISSLAIWSTSADATVICRDKCGRNGCWQVCRVVHATMGPFWAATGYGWPYHYRYTEVRPGTTVSPY
jgi:hypothetical protein